MWGGVQATTRGCELAAMRSGQRHFDAEARQRKGSREMLDSCCLGVR